MTALRNPKGTTISSRRAMEKIIYDFYSDLFDSHVHLPPHRLREDGHVIPEVLPPEIRHAIMSVRNRTAPRIRPEHLKNLPVLIHTLARLFTRYLSECKVPKQWMTSKTVLLYKKGDLHDIERTLDEGQPCEQAGFREKFTTTDHVMIMSVKNSSSFGLDRIKLEHLKFLPPVLINTLTRFFTCYLSECKVPKRWKTSKVMLLYETGDPQDISNYRSICLLSVIYKLFTRVVLNRIERTLDEGQPCEQSGFKDLKKAVYSVGTEAVTEALDNQGPTPCIKILHPEINYDKRRDLRAGQEETNGLRSIQYTCGEEDQKLCA
ncbi:hypothetical protein RB195_023707 [Necator americanus]|uniref:Reverse transcriptase domain-containing protein n=1 Tax=Necator americanus TaxID=51031 RepID=A0ABR1EK92_NECAM